MEYRVTFTVISSSPEYPPLTIAVSAPQDLALMLMKTPVGQVSIAVETVSAKGRLLEDKSKLLDFK